MSGDTRSILATWALLLASATVLLALKWPSFEAFWLATRHAPFPAGLPAPALEVSRAYQYRVDEIRAVTRARLDAYGDRSIRTLNELVFQTESLRRATEVESLTAELAKANARLAALESEHDAAVAARIAAEALVRDRNGPVARLPGGANLAPGGASPAVGLSPGKAGAAPVGAPGERVLFVGDSLMQGVAPHVRRVLCNRPDSRCTDLSQPSTGLSQRWFHDWPRAVADALARERYTVLVVFLGANDPWDMIDGSSRIRFGTDAWQAAYTERVRSIVRTARNSGARVYWVGLPSMRLARLQEGSYVQNDIFTRVVGEEGGVFISTREVVGDGSATYSRFVKLADGRAVVVRLDDGVHFTLAGQRMIADAVLARLVPSALASVP